MVINPYKLFKRGYIIKGRKDCLTPNGYDLRLKSICEITKDLHSTIIANNTGIGKKAYGIIKPRFLNGDRNRLYYYLRKNTPYELRTVESLYIPKNMVGMVFSRSSFNRVGVIIRGTLFDSGFKGTPSLTIYPFQAVYLAKGTRIAQIVFVKADTYKVYRGQYQEE